MFNLYKISDEMTMNEFKQRIINGLLLCVMFVSIPKLALNIIYNQIPNHPWVLWIQLVLYIGMVILFFVRKQVPIGVQVTLMVNVFVLLGVLSLIMYGIISSGILLILGLITTTLLRKKRESIRYIFLSMLTMIIIGYLFKIEIFEYVGDFNQLGTDLNFWLTRSTDVAMYMAIIFIAISMLREYLEKTIHYLQAKNKELTHVYEDLAASEEEIKSQYATLQKMAFHDSLTGLPNRSCFEERINNGIKEGLPSFQVLFIDIDDFKHFNDFYGQDAGDEIIHNLANRLTKVVSEGDMVYRLLGDELGIFIQGSTSLFEESESTIRRVERIFHIPIIVKHVKHKVTVSYGIAKYPEHGQSGAELIKNAELAMRSAKDEGKNTHRLFQQKMIDDLNEKHLMEIELREMIKEKKVMLVYQPQVDSLSHQIVGFEALARWQSKGFGFVSPVKFIPILEEAGLIIEYGRLVLRQGIKDLGVFNQLSAYPLKMSVNISPVQFEQGDFVSYIEELVAEHQIMDHQLELEITEGTLIANRNEVNDKLKHLREKGINVALDDFGTGYSSLSYIVELSMDTLKIDKSFIDDVDRNEMKEKVLKAIVSLAHDLQLRVIAEGVETKEQLSVVIENKCNVIQGYLFYKPLPSEAIQRLLIHEADYIHQFKEL